MAGAADAAALDADLAGARQQQSDLDAATGVAERRLAAARDRLRT